MTLDVALLSREFPPEVYGGAGVHVDELSRALAGRSDCDVAVHAFGAPRTDDPRVARSYLPWEALAGEAPSSAALRTMSVDLAMAAGVGGADVLHSHTWYANLAGHLGALLHEVPHVVTTHSLEPLRPWKAEQLGGGYALSSWCERTGIEGADAVIAVSAGMRADVLDCYPAVDPARVHVVHNGIDPQGWAPLDDPGRLRALGIDPSRPTVAFVGRITRQKGLVHLLAAAALLPGDAQLVLLAGAPDTRQIATEVRAGVDALRAGRDGVVWIDRMLGRDDVRAVLTAATVFVCPSVYEPFGLVNVEAMACGTAVVATAVGGVPEVVVDGETGLLVPLEADADGLPRDPETLAEQLAAALTELLEDPARAAAMGAAGRRRAIDAFGWDAIAERTVEVYRAVSPRGLSPRTSR